jgi:hypothetical protein
MMALDWGEEVIQWASVPSWPFELSRHEEHGKGLTKCPNSCLGQVVRPQGIHITVVFMGDVRRKTFAIGNEARYVRVRLSMPLKAMFSKLELRGYDWVEGRD